MHFLLLAAGIVAAYWLYNDARRFGHGQGTALLWAAATVPFPYIFLPLYLLFGRKPQAARRPPEVVDVEGLAVEETMNCPMCGGKVKEEFKACPYCSHTLKPVCAGCGRELRRDWKTCPYCGASAAPK